MQHERVLEIMEELKNYQQIGGTLTLSVMFQVSDKAYVNWVKRAIMKWIEALKCNYRYRYVIEKMQKRPSVEIRFLGTRIALNTVSYVDIRIHLFKA